MTKVKICGLRSLADIEKVNRYLPDYIGFVFADSRRFVTDEQALEMSRALDRRIQAVGGNRWGMWSGYVTGAS